MAKPHGRFQALTVTGAGILRELRTTCHICPAYDPDTTPQAQRPAFEPFTGIWDTGASGTCITQAVVDRCGLKPFKMTNVSGAYGGSALRNVYLIHMGLPSGVMVRNVAAVIGEMPAVDVLIGMDVIALGDFAITNQGGVTIFSFRIPSLHTIDYVKQAKQLQQVAGVRQGGSSVIPAKRKKRR